ncbi:MAG: hypothetical protein M1834_005018 [Cirrosporium novae-zelandiae]|nr:MAG: hypothetical protein M1834_005018 [Cirrosporium novae-zelandiae]
MDHLPHPINPCHRIEIAYLDGEDFGALDFFSYPQAKGIDIDALAWGDTRTHTPQQVRAFLQSWLFFGLLNQILDPEIRHVDFICKEDQRRSLISTESLDDYIARWKKRFQSLQNSARKEEQFRVRAILQHASRTLNMLASSSSYMMAPDFVGPELDISLRICIQTLEYALVRDLLPRQRVLDDHDTQTCSILLDKLNADGWCPNQIDMLAHCMDAPSMYYVMLLGTPEPRKSHSKCSRQQCLADQIDASRYLTNHFRETCQCDFLGPDMEKVGSILEGGGIPLVSFENLSHSRPANLEAVEYTPGMAYVALSHVWSDGLGNARNNSLPLCQLQFFREAVSHVAGITLFWVDTLCVPLSPAKLRKSAIRLMKETYANAHSVLVIDSAIMKLPVSISEEELFMRITCSGWIRRLWTFQEGFLAKCLLFLLHDGIADIMSRFRKLLEKGVDGTIIPRSTVAQEGVRLFQSFLSHRSEGNTPMGFGELWSALQWRSTSRASDEPLCLAPLLGIDINIILDLPEEQRMKKLLSLQHDFPPYIIFSKGPRMPDVGYRWAPPCLMVPRCIDIPKMHHMIQEAQWDPKGLLVPFCGLVLTMPKPTPVDFEMSFCVKDTVENTWYVVVSEPDPSLREQDRWDQMYIKDLTSAGIIFSCPFELLGEELWDAVLVTIQHSENGVLYSHFLSTVSVGRLRSDQRSSAEEDLLKMQRLLQSTEALGKICACTGRSVPYPQRWCVG